MTTRAGIAQTIVGIIVTVLMAIAFTPDNRLVLIPPIAVLVLTTILLSLFNRGRGLFLGILVLVCVIMSLIPVAGYLFMAIGLFLSVLLITRVTK